MNIIIKSPTKAPFKLLRPTSALVVRIIGLVLFGGMAHADATGAQSFLFEALRLNNVDPVSLIHWKIGDSADYQITAIFGKIGTMHKEVTGEEGTGVWITQKADMMGNHEDIQTLIDRNTGKVLKMIHNGKEEAVPADNPEIISEDYTEVTVPAGTYKALHVVAKTQQVSHLEVWINNKEVAMEGAIKEVIQAQFGNVTLELTQQHQN